jgi:hypothetical protein
MLLQLCGVVAVGADRSGTAPFCPELHAITRDPQLCEQGYPAFLLAEALAQIACRTARAADGADRRMMPVRIMALTAATVPATAGCGGRLVARLLRSQPLSEFACALEDATGVTIASATITVAPTEIS